MVRGIEVIERVGRTLVVIRPEGHGFLLGREPIESGSRRVPRPAVSGGGRQGTVGAAVPRLVIGDGLLTASNSPIGLGGSLRLEARPGATCTADFASAP